MCCGMAKQCISMCVRLHASLLQRATFEVHSLYGYSVLLLAAVTTGYSRSLEWIPPNCGVVSFNQSLQLLPQPPYALLL